MMRRYYATALFFLLCASVFVLGYRLYAVHLRRVEFFSGWLLAAVFMAMILLWIARASFRTAFFSAARCQFFHIFLGALSLVGFFLHTGFRLPDNLLQIILAGFYLIIILTGIFGLLFTYAAPRRIARHGESDLSEHIPLFRKMIRSEMEQLVLKSVESTGSEDLATFYRSYLEAFFSPAFYSNKSVFTHRKINEKLRKLFIEMQRGFNESHRDYVDKMMELTRQKAAIEYRYARRSLLRSWLTVHVSISISFFILVILHMALVHAFSG